MPLYPSADHQIADLQRQLAETTRQRDQLRTERDVLRVRLVAGLSEVCDEFEADASEAQMIADFNEEQAAAAGIDLGEEHAHPEAQSRADTLMRAAGTIRRHILAAENDAPIPTSPTIPDLQRVGEAWQRRQDDLDRDPLNAITGPTARRTVELMTHSISTRIASELQRQCSTRPLDEGELRLGNNDLPTWISPTRIADALTHTAGAPPSTANTPNAIYHELHDQYRNMLVANMGRELAVADRHLNMVRSTDTYNAHLRHRNSLHEQFTRLRASTVELPEWIDVDALADAIDITRAPEVAPSPAMGATTSRATDFPSHANLATRPSPNAAMTRVDSSRPRPTARAAVAAPVNER